LQISVSSIGFREMTKRVVRRYQLRRVHDFLVAEELLDP